MILASSRGSEAAKAVAGRFILMPTETYLTQEGVETRIRDMRSEIRYIRRKNLTELVIASIVLMYSFTFVNLRFTFLLILFLSVNFVSWALWTLMALTRVTRGFSTLRRFKEEEDPLDEYRRLGFHLAASRRQDAVFDFLIGVQFLFVAARFAGLILFRW